MFIGHIGVGLALKKAEWECNVAWFVAGALFLDLVLWLLVLLRMETVYIPQNFTQIHYLTFNFPYSHSLVASLLWSALFFLIGTPLFGKRAGFLFAAAVFSHFICDLIEHVPDLAIYDDMSPKLGLSLWKHMPIAIGLEIVIAVVGLRFYLQSTRPGNRRFAKHGMTFFVIFVSLLQIVSMYAPGLPDAAALASNSFVSLTIIIVLVYLLDKRRVHASLQA
ncbi:MAG: hypothetical protein C5B54_12225 [Acidobacteria bacterium]|nr:MAG: hypothetical protein C5B54_12225 [Acidobacteriota bacterium]